MKRTLTIIATSIVMVFSGATALAQDTLILDTPLTAQFISLPVSFNIQAEEGQTVLIEVTADGADLALEMYDSSGGLIATDDDSSGNLNPALGVQFQTADTYRVDVLSYRETRGNVDFTISMRPLDIITEASINLGDTVRSVLGDVPPTFSITLSEETTILAAMLTYNFPPVITIADARGNEIRRADGFLVPVTLPAGEYRITLAPLYEGFSLRPYYALSVTETTITPLTLGESLTVEAINERARYFTFDGSAGDVIDVVVQTQSEDAMNGASFVVTAPDNGVVFYAETSPSTAYLAAGELPLTGSYRIEVFPYTTGFNTPFSISLSQGERLELTAQPQTVVYGKDVLTRNFVVSVEEGKVYRLSMTNDNALRPVSMFAQNMASLSAYGSVGASIDFPAPFTGTMIFAVRVEQVGYDELGNLVDSGDATLTLRIEEVTQ